MSDTVGDWFGTLTNDAGIAINEAFPAKSSTYLIEKIKRMYWSLQYELIFILSEKIYDDITTFKYVRFNASYGSSTYNEVLRNFTYIYLHSGELKKRFTSGLKLEYNSTRRNETLDKFADRKYEEFHIGAAFDEEFPIRFAAVYRGIYNSLMDIGQRIYNSSDHVGMQIQYMR